VVQADFRLGDILLPLKYKVMVARDELTLTGSGGTRTQFKRVRLPDLIVGKWEPVDEKTKGTIIEFTRDGKVKLDFSGFKIEGKYKSDDDGILATEVSGPDNKVRTTKSRVKVTEGEVTITLEAGIKQT
jgi:hypothetical protein